MNRFFSRAATAVMALAVSISLFSCAPVNLYTVTMQYLPPETAAPAAGKAAGIPVTVAAFNDAREIDDTIRIGTVVLSDGKEVPILPKDRRPAETVTEAVRKCLSEEGYSPSPETPAWDLKIGSIDKLWGTALLMGGTIDRLEVVCHKEGVKKTYRTDVKLTIVFADARGARILRTTEAAATSSLVHVSFSEEMLGQQISTTLSKAIRQVCSDGKTIPEILGRMARERD